MRKSTRQAKLPKMSLNVTKLVQNEFSRAGRSFVKRVIAKKEIAKKAIKAKQPKQIQKKIMPKQCGKTLKKQVQPPAKVPSRNEQTKAKVANTPSISTPSPVISSEAYKNLMVMCNMMAQNVQAGGQAPPNF